MKAVTWHGKPDVRVDEIPDPRLEERTDAIVRVTSSGLCGSDLHLYELLGPFMGEGDVLGHVPRPLVVDRREGVVGAHVALSLALMTHALQPFTRPRLAGAARV